MIYLKRFVCLANSRKFAGRCIAGIEVPIVGNGRWIRPTSSRVTEELSIVERRYGNGSDVAVLDVVEVSLAGHRPHTCQTENHLIDDTRAWKLVDRMVPSDLVDMAAINGPLWRDGASSFNGRNDRISTHEADQLDGSLMLVMPQEAQFEVSMGLHRRQVRLGFQLASASYRLSVTDPKLESEYLRRQDGEYRCSQRVLICVSLGEPFEGYRYKLAASVIGLD